MMLLKEEVLNLQELFLLLDHLKISYEKMEHKEVYTIKDAQFIKEHLNGMGCKNLFLKDQESNYYFILLPDYKRGDLKLYQTFFHTSRLSFATDYELKKYLHVTKGSVTPFGLLYNDGSIPILIDKELKSQNLLFHPLINTSTVRISYDDFIRFLEYVKNPYFLV